MDTTAHGWHLGETPHELAFAEFQHALICLTEAFYRHAGHSLAKIADEPKLNGYDSVIFNVIYMAGQPKGLTEIQHFTNRSDPANVQYSLRKLLAAGLIEPAPRVPGGRGVMYRPTDKGNTAAMSYSRARCDLLARFPVEHGALAKRLGDAGTLMDLMTGLYDQATRRLMAD